MWAKKKMINITLPDGSIKKVESGTSAMDIAINISEGLARNVLSASINGEVWDANRPNSPRCISNITYLE